MPMQHLKIINISDIFILCYNDWISIIEISFNYQSGQYPVCVLYYTTCVIGVILPKSGKKLGKTCQLHVLARCFYQPETVTAIYTENQRHFFQIWLQFHEDMCINSHPRQTRYSLWSIVPFSHHWIPRYPINGITKMFVHMS